MSLSGSNKLLPILMSFLNYFNKPILKIPVIIGLITGLLTFAYFLGLYALDVNPLGNIRTPDFGIHIITICYACWYFRKKIGLGWMHLWEGLTIGYVLNMTAAFLTGWLVYLFVTIIDPQIFTDYLNNMEHLLLDGKEKLVEQIGEEEFGVLLSNVKDTDPSTLISDEISKKFVIGIIPILLISLFFRRQQPIK